MAAAHQLPDDCWLVVLSNLSARDVAAMLLTCRRLCFFTKSEALWRSLMERDYPESAAAAGSCVPSWRDAYRQLFVKETRTRNAAHRRAVLRAASKVDSTKRTIAQLTKSLAAEEQRGENILAQLRHLEQIRRAEGVAVAQVWQPRTVQTWQEQLLEQVPVDLGTRIASLQQDVRAGELQKLILRRSLKAQRAVEAEVQADLDRLQYHPSPKGNTSLGGSSSLGGASSLGSASSSGKNMSLLGPGMHQPGLPAASPSPSGLKRRATCGAGPSDQRAKAPKTKSS